MASKRKPTTLSDASGEFVSTFHYDTLTQVTESPYNGRTVTRFATIEALRSGRERVRETYREMDRQAREYR
jgi:hypothetical protein